MQQTCYFSNMISGGTISYKIINKEIVDSSVLESTNIISCTIQNSIFTGTNFRLSDFDGTILIQCKFISGDWSQADCCSLTAVNTIFRDIDFTFSTMRGCDFKNCTFIDCKFDHVALSGSRFEQCNFEHIHIVQSSTYLNTYLNCKFENCNINGNFYYNLLIGNIYIKSMFNKKIFAFNYIFMDDEMNLETIGLDTVKKEEVKNFLLENMLLINCVILELNDSKDTDTALIRFIVAIGRILENGILVREEQLRFIYSFLRYLLEKNAISAVTIVETLSFLEKTFTTFESQQNDAYKKCKDTLVLIKNELYNAYQTIGQSIDFLYNREEPDIERIVKIVYEQEPQIPICSILNEIKASLGIDAPDAVRIKAEVGSFHEWISCYDSILQCLQLFLAVLGLGYTVVSNYQKKNHKNISNEGEGEPLSNMTSEQMLTILNKTLSKQKINPEFSQAINIVVKNDIIATKQFRGYKRSNIQSIDIITKNS